MDTAFPWSSRARYWSPDVQTMVNCRKSAPSVATFTAPAVTARAITMAAASGGTELGKGLPVHSLVDHGSASCKISFSFPLARMSQVCTVEGLAPMAAAVSCTEQPS